MTVKLCYIYTLQSEIRYIQSLNFCKLYNQRCRFTDSWNLKAADALSKSSGGQYQNLQTSSATTVVSANHWKKYQQNDVSY